MLGGVVKLALQNDELRRIRKGDVLSKYTLPQNWHSVSEPTVVRKINGGTGTYVIFVATRVIDKSPSSPVTAEAMREADFSMKSKVIVLDGDRLDEVVFAWDLPYRVPYGLHSMFLDWEKMK